MSSNIVEFFGYAPNDKSPVAIQCRKESRCPFVNKTCTKTLSDGLISGVCTLKPTRDGAVICCPIRLYADNYKILQEISNSAFGQPTSLHAGSKARRAPIKANQARVAVFGKGWGGELRLPNRGKAGGYYVDWVLAKIKDNGDLDEFIAIEVQSIDTTGNYREERNALLHGKKVEGSSTAGFNWENVNKRILPQLIYKGNVLQRERYCRKGLFFVCPQPVYEKIRERLGNGILQYPLQTGSISFWWYDLGPEVKQGQLRKLKHAGSFTTAVVQVATAFISPTNLPEENVYEAAILDVLKKEV